jgi:hypothetical protein
MLLECGRFLLRIRFIAGKETSLCCVDGVGCYERFYLSFLEVILNLF